MSCNAKVVVEAGNVNRALNKLKKDLTTGGTWREVMFKSADSDRACYVKSSVRKRVKSLRARKRVARAAAKARARVAMLDRLGLDDRPRRPAA
jgi:ribosomal protein S21